MTTRQDEPPVAVWLRGKAQTHRRAAASARRNGQPEQAKAYQLAAAAISDVAREAEEHMHPATPTPCVRP